MTGSEGGKGKQVSSHGDQSFDYIFEWSEKACCPAVMRNYQPDLKPDTLDFVFENVESLTCRQDEKELDIHYNGQGIKRDNSLVEADVYGQPLPEENEGKIKPFGQQGDIADFVLEHAESYACSVALPNDKATLASSVPTVEPGREIYRGINSRIEQVYEPEDEIQLYFRPKRRKRRSHRGGF